MDAGNKQQLRLAIRNLAETACRKMSISEQEEFFKYQEQRIASGEAIPKRYKVPVRKYYKGAQKGKKKEVYEIDGKTFEQLWNKLLNYALISSVNSHSNGFTDINVQEDVLDIRYHCFRILRFFGPKPMGVTFDKFFPLLVHSLLINSANRRKKTLRTQINFKAVSLFEPIPGNGFEDDESYLIDTLADESLPKQRDLELLLDTPEPLREGVENLLGGTSLTKVCKKLKVKTSHFREQMEPVLR